MPVDEPFLAVDLDASGEVTAEEIASVGLDVSEEAFETADVDGSGGLGEDEFAELEAPVATMEREEGRPPEEAN